MTELLLAAILGFSTFDAWLSRRRIAKFGLEIEMNTLIRWLVSKVGLEAGVLVGVFAPSLALAAVLSPWEGLLGVIAGYKASWFTLQLGSFRLERQLEEFRRSKNGPSPPPDTRPPDSSNSNGT